MKTKQIIFLAAAVAAGAGIGGVLLPELKDSMTDAAAVTTTTAPVPVTTTTDVDIGPEGRRLNNEVAAMTTVWGRLTDQERTTVCDAVEYLGVESAAAFLGAVERDVAVAFLSDAC